MKDRRIRECPAGRLTWRQGLILLAVGMVMSCASTGPGESPSPSLDELLAAPGPKVVAILPFENASDEPDMAGLVRTTFYSHFSPKNYRDIELSRVDQILEAHGHGTQPAWTSLQPSELGTLLRADFLIFGKVLNFKKTYLGIYSQIAITVGLEVVACESEKGVWQQTLTKRSHDGGLPFTLFDLVPAALRSGLHMQHEWTVGLVDRISRELARDIPEPAVSPIPPVHVELQVASFMDPGRAMAAARGFEARGMHGRVEPVTLKGRVYHRVLLGPFRALEEAEAARERIIRETEFQPVVVYGDGDPDTQRFSPP